jgi:hypothetical protein
MCVPARNWSEESLGKFCDQLGTTYSESAVALENAGVDLDICFISNNSSALEVAFPPPGIGAKI